MIAEFSPNFGFSYADKNRGQWASEAQDPVAVSLGIYLMKSGFSIDQLRTDESKNAIQAITPEVVRVLDGDEGSMPKNCRYMQDRTVPLETQLAVLADNATRVHSAMGEDFFRNRQDRSEPMVHYTTGLLGGTMWLGVKGGSGAGSFSVDIAVGKIQRNDFRHMRGEMWRVGVDSTKTDGVVRSRVIKLGSAMTTNKNGNEEKRALSREFLNTYRISIPRAMAALALLAAHSIKGAEQLQLVTQRTFSEPKFTGHSGLGVKFDYVRLFSELGFDAPLDKAAVMTFPNEPYEFYRRFLDTDRKGQGIHCGELNGLEQIIASFNGATDAVSDRVNPLQLLGEDDEELLGHWLASKDLHLRSMK